MSTNERDSHQVAIAWIKLHSIPEESPEREELFWAHIHVFYRLRLVRISGMQSMKSNFMPVSMVWMALILLASCGESGRSISVDGIDGEFCPPKDYLPQGVWFVPPDTKNSGSGFSFMGCSYLPKDSEEICNLPNELISASVRPIAETRNQSWKELKNAAGFALRVSEPGTEMDLEETSGRVILHNPNFGNDWSTWGRQADNSSPSKPMMLDSDRLIVTCSIAEGATISTQLDYSCSRFVAGPRYGVDYQFSSDSKSPSEDQIDRLEKKLFTQIENWRCPKS